MYYLNWGHYYLTKWPEKPSWASKYGEILNWYPV